MSVKQYTTAGGHWFFLPGMYCWQIGKWALPKQDLAQVSLCIRQVARLLRLLHDTFAEVTSLLPSHLVSLLPYTSSICTTHSTARKCMQLHLHARQQGKAFRCHGLAQALQAVRCQCRQGLPLQRLDGVCRVSMMTCKRCCNGRSMWAAKSCHA